jgi:hypothetical protein
MSRIQQLEEQMKDANRFTSTVAGLIYNAIESLGEFGALIPIAEIIVTIYAYWRSGLGELFGLEVLAGLVFAQVAALFLTAHYKNIALSQIGETAVYGSILIGAANTGIAIFLALSMGHGTVDVANMPRAILYFPAISSAMAVLAIYTAKMFTMERVAARLKFRTESNADIQAIQRRANAQHSNATHLNTMQATQMKIQVETMTQLANDPMIKNAYTLIMREQALKNVLQAFDVHPSTKIAKLLQKQIVDANEAAAQAAPVGGLPIAWPVETNGLSSVDLAAGAAPNE